jgi:hypothetical protein
MNEALLINDRTRKPATVISAENDPSRIVKEGGRLMHDVLFIVDAETKERMEQGWVCAYCTEPLAEAFPVQCNFCGFPVRDQQTHYISKQSVGDVRLGSKIKLAEEVERMNELVEYEKRTGLVLPDGVWNGTEEIR